MPLPCYSVLIPAYNCKDTLNTTVHSALNQSHPPLEILLLDDCSTDGTRELIENLAKEHPIIKPYYNESNMGVAETRNRGFSLANGDSIALLDADDLWEPTKMEEQLSFMVNNPCNFSYTGYSFMDHKGNPLDKIYNVPTNLSFEEMLKENVIGCATVVLSKEIAQNYKMNGSYSHEDYVFWLQLLQDGKVAKGINKPLMRYRLSPTSRSGDKKKAAQNRWIIYRQFLKFGRCKSLRYFVSYAIRGLLKHK